MASSTPSVPKDIWQVIQRKASLPEEGGFNLWAWLQERLDPALYAPHRAEGVVEQGLRGREGDYYILKSLQGPAYLRLAPEDHFLWEQMDGTLSIRDLIVAYYMEYGAFALDRVVALVQKLRANGFLRDHPRDIFYFVSQRLWRRSPRYWLSRAVQALLAQQWSIQGLDRLIDTLYRFGGRVLFTLPLQILFLVISIMGVFLFWRILNSAEYSLLMAGNSFALGAATLWAVFILPVVVHELSHALTVKHYGREVRRGGVLLYFGLPGAFVDTTDIWLEPPRRRIAVSWAGPYSGLVLSGLAALFIFWQPAASVNSLLFKMAFLSYVSVFFNLNPLLRLDGYYMLLDWLEIPLLRERSLRFVRTRLLEKILRREGFKREEKIFAFFGLMAAAWTLYAIWLGYYFWQSRISVTLGSILQRGGSVVSILFFALTVIIFGSFILGIGVQILALGRVLLFQALRRGWLATPQRIAVAMAGGVLFLSLLPLILPSPWSSLYALLATLLFGLMSLYQAGRLQRVHRGSVRQFPMQATISAIVLLISPWLIEKGLLPGLGEMVGGTVIAAMGAIGLLSLGLGGVLFFLRGGVVAQGLKDWVLVALGIAIIWGLTLLALSDTVFLPLLMAAGLSGYFLYSLSSPSSPLFPSRLLQSAGFTVLLFSHSGLGVEPLLGWGLILAGLYHYDLALRVLGAGRRVLELEPGITDRDRLGEATRFVLEALSGYIGRMLSRAEAQKIEESFNRQAKATGWGITLRGGRAEVEFPEEQGILDRGELARAAVEVLVSHTIGALGRHLAEAALVQAYDGLGWQEREVAGPYLFAAGPWGGVLLRDLRRQERDRLAVLKTSPLFSGLADDEMKTLAVRFQEEKFTAGQAIISQGEMGDKFYVISSGRVAVEVEGTAGPERVAELSSGDYFGEIALLQDVPRTATCRAITHTTVLSLGRADFNALVRRYFTIGQKMARAISTVQLLQRMPLFADWDPSDLKTLAARFSLRPMAKGDILVRQGDPGDRFYVLKSGQVEVLASTAEGEQVVNRLGPGEYFGEVALLLDLPRTATVRALTDGEVLVLDRKDFQELLQRSLVATKDFEQVSSRRLKELRRRGAI